VILAASEILVTLIHKAGLDEAIGGTDFLDVYDVTPESSRALDVLRVHDSGTIVRTVSKPVPDGASQKTQRRAEGALVRWDVTHFYGSEELSALSAPIAELAPASYVELHPDDAKARGFTDGSEADLIREFGLKAKLRINPELAKSTAAFPILMTRSPATAEVVAG
jgi:hypothetical protein